MTTSVSRRGFLTFAGGTALAGVAAFATRTTSDPVFAQGDGTPNAMASPMGMHNSGTAAAFMVITNNGTSDDRLLGGKTDVAAVVEVHEMKQQGEMMIMSPLVDGLPIPAGETVTLEPGGYHIMMIGLTKDLKPGETYELTVEFETAGEVTLTVPIFATKMLADKDLAANPGEPVVAGDLTLTNVWTRMAPMLAEGSPMAMPDASPMATPDM